MKPIICNKESELITNLINDKEQEYHLLGIFMREVDANDDELFVVVQKNNDKKIYSYLHSNQEALSKISDIYYDAFMYQNEIYDFYGKPTKNIENYILRLHLYPDNYFPKRKKWKAMITKKNPYVFTKIEGDSLTEVQVWPIHAWVIPPWHFRFTVDGEDIINLDNQMWRKHRGVEQYFMQERNLEKLIEAVQEIAWDSAVAYSTTFARMIEKSAQIKISEEAKLTRIILMELERIYNHLRTMWALWNDVGQAFILNWFLAVREQFLEMNNRLFWSRILKNTIKVWWVTKTLDKQEQDNLVNILNEVKSRVNNLVKLATKWPWNYDRFKDTGIVTKETANKHGALWVAARASTVVLDERQYDEYYTSLDIPFKVCVWEQWDALDRFLVRANEYKTSAGIIKFCMRKLSQIKEIHHKDYTNIVLKDGVNFATTEWHRGQIFQMIVVEKWEIVYFKVKDPSFVNRNLIDYSVLNNIIADFPICNKSLDLSYSGFDV